MRLFAVFACALFLLASESRSEEPAPLRVAGAESLLRLMEDWAGEVALPLEQTGRGNASGPSALLRGEATIAVMDRSLRPPELRALTTHYGEPPRIVEIGTDALVVIVHPSNLLAGLRLNEVAALFSEESACGEPRVLRVWGELGERVGGAWRERRVGALGSSKAGGTPARFRKAALCGGHFRGDLHRQPGEAALVAAVAESPWSLGFTRRGFLSARVRPLPLSLEGDDFRPPEEAFIADGSYPLARSLWLVAPPEDPPPQALGALLAFAVSGRGNTLTRAHGFLPASARAAASLKNPDP